MFKEGNTEFSELPDGKKRYFDDLMSHQDEIQRDSETMYYFEGFYTLLAICLKEKLPPRNRVLEIFGKMLVNSFDIMDNSSDLAIGQALYLKASVIGKNSNLISIKI